MGAKSKTVLFVCTGNVCRSPMAEFIFRHRTGDGSGWQAVSAGTLAFSGTEASASAVDVLAEAGIDLSPHRSRELTRELVASADLILSMTESQRQEVLLRFPEATGRTRLLSSFGSGGLAADIPDPIGQSIEVYRYTRERIDSALSDVILHLVEQRGLRCAAAPPPAELRVALGINPGEATLGKQVKKHLEDKHVRVEEIIGNDSDPAEVAAQVARRVSEGAVDRGLLIGPAAMAMALAAGQYPRVRTAVCTAPPSVRVGAHINLLILAGDGMTREEVVASLEEWLKKRRPGVGSAERAAAASQDLARSLFEPPGLADADPDISAVLREETHRQLETIDLIASENYASRNVREATASVLTNKYAEGYPGRRWYPGCEGADEVERLAVGRARELFGAEHANVQPHSGSAANMAVFFAALAPGDTFLAMDPAQGGHFSHGHEVNFSGRIFKAVHYGVARENEILDYDQIQRLAEEVRPRLICAGASSYSRHLDYPRLRKLADRVKALLMVDMAHVAGLVAAGVHPSPVPYADFVTTTTHKTLRGPRGGLILCRQKLADEIDRQVFPGLQGGPLLHVMAAKAVCFLEAFRPEFKRYGLQVVRNAQALAAALQEGGFRIVSGGTDNHLMILDLGRSGLTGKDAVVLLEKAGITVNKCPIPYDPRNPAVASGVRMGTPAVTTRQMGEEEMELIARWIQMVLKNPENENVLSRVREETRELARNYPLP